MTRFWFYSKENNRFEKQPFWSFFALKSFEFAICVVCEEEATIVINAILLNTRQLSELANHCLWNGLLLAGRTLLWFQACGAMNYYFLALNTHVFEPFQHPRLSVIQSVKLYLNIKRLLIAKKKAHSEVMCCYF